MQGRFIKRFFQLESAEAIMLFVMTALALFLVNSPFAKSYHAIFSEPLYLRVGSFNIHQSFSFWINEGLMSLFFLLIALELKREFLYGELKKISQILLPAVAAIGGMIVPAVIYLIFNAKSDNVLMLNGWAIPVATDIAFALGALSLFGKRVPVSLKLFLMTLAIFDDIGAIVIIALFHTYQFSWIALSCVGCLILLLFLCNFLKIRSVMIYSILGLLLWVSVLKSGFHATLAGLIFGFMVPLDRFSTLERKLHPIVSFGIIPLFALANAGLSFAGISLETFKDPIVIGIMLGLFLGKQLGVMGFTWSAIRLKWAKLPGTSWRLLYGVALLCGIGFTMSLFLGTLAFQRNEVFLTEMRLGVLSGSLLSGVFGIIVLAIVLRQHKKEEKSA